MLLLFLPSNLTPPKNPAATALAPSPIPERGTEEEAVEEVDADGVVFVAVADFSLVSDVVVVVFAGVERPK